MILVDFEVERVRAFRFREEFFFVVGQLLLDTAARMFDFVDSWSADVSFGLHS